MLPGSPLDARWRLSSPSADYLILRRADPLPQERSHRVPAPFITSELERWLDSAFSAPVLESLYQALGGQERSSSSEPTRYRQQLKERLARAFESGELVALELERAAAPSPPPPRHSTPRHYKPEPVLPEQRTFIAIELVDDEGRPVGYQRYRLELPYGAPREGRLNAHGCAYVDGILPGECKVSFPDLDAEDWS